MLFHPFIFLTWGIVASAFPQMMPLVPRGSGEILGLDKRDSLERSSGGLTAKHFKWMPAGKGDRTYHI